MNISQIPTQTINFTITIPFYKDERYLRRAICSVLNQKLADWTLIISTEQILSNELQCYLSELADHRIQWVLNENPGISSNWNNCINLCQSEYLTILHSDDELAPNYLLVMKSLIEKAPEASLYICDTKIIDENSQPIFSFSDKIKKILRPKQRDFRIHGDSGLAGLLKGCYIFCPAICYKSNIMKNNLFSDKWKMVLDLELYSRLLFNGHSFFMSKQSAFLYRRHEFNQTTKLTQDLSRFTEEVALYDAIAQKADTQNWSSTQRIAKSKIIIKLHLLFLWIKSVLAFNHLQARKIRQFMRRLYQKE